MIADFAKNVIKIYALKNKTVDFAGFFRQSANKFCPVGWLEDYFNIFSIGVQATVKCYDKHFRLKET